MKTNNKMNAAERMAAWATVTDPIECLEELVEHSMFIGNDPYYRDLDGALWAMVNRVLEINQENTNVG